MDIIEKLKALKPEPYSVCQYEGDCACESERGIVLTEAERDALLALVEPQWQPIETAPKDGRCVLVARHMPPYGWIVGYATWCVVREVSGWVSHGLGAFGVLGLADPTHWRPLPAPPVPASASPGEK